jgi:hypothetical protein
VLVNATVALSFDRYDVLICGTLMSILCYFCVCIFAVNIEWELRMIAKMRQKLVICLMSTVTSNRAKARAIEGYLQLTRDFCCVALNAEINLSDYYVEE